MSRTSTISALLEIANAIQFTKGDVRYNMEENERRSRMRDAEKVSVEPYRHAGSN